MNVDDTFDLIASCIEQVYSEEESWSSADCTKKELKDFLEQLDSKQFKNIESCPITRANYPFNQPASQQPCSSQLTLQTTTTRPLGSQWAQHDPSKSFCGFRFFFLL